MSAEVGGQRSEVGGQTLAAAAPRTAAVFWRIVWKEYRTMRGFWIAMAVMGVLGEFAVSRVMPNRFVRPLTGTATGAEGVARAQWEVDSVAVLSVALIFAALYCTVCGATMFAGETELRTHEFLRGLPISGQRLLRGKLGFAILSTLFLLAILFAAAIAVMNGAVADGSMVLKLLGFWGPAALEGLVWGILFSLLLKRPLLAAILAVAVTAASIYTTYWIISRRLIELGYVEQRSAMAVYRLGVPAIVFLIDFMIVKHAFGGVRPKPGKLLARFHSKTMPNFSAESQSTSAPTRATVFGRLLWQTWRQSRWMMIALAVIGGVTALTPLNEILRVLPLFDRETPEGMRPALVIAVIASLMGSSVFLADQERGRVRVLAEQGVRPRTVWLARELTWFGMLAIWAIIVLGLWFYFSGGPVFLRSGRLAGLLPGELFTREFYGAYEHLPPIAVSIHLTITSFTCGQLASMLFRSGIVAAVVGMFLSLTIAVWLLLMQYLGVSWLLFVAPISLAMLFGTWLRSPDWALELNSSGRWLKVAAAIAVPIAAVLVAEPIYRVNEIPEVSLGFAPNEFLRSWAPTDEQRETAHMYRRASELIVGDPQTIGYSTIRPPGTREIEFLAANSKALGLALEASRRPVGAFDDSTFLGEDYWKGRSGISTLLSISGRQLESEGKLDEALDRYMAVLHEQATYEIKHRGVFEYAAEQLPFWAAAKGQTRERIVGAIKRLEQFEASLPPATDVIKANRTSERRQLETGRVAGFVEPRDYKSEEFLINALAAVLPGERERALRLFDAMAARDIDLIARIANALKRGEPVMDLLPERSAGVWMTPGGDYRDAERWQTWLKTTPIRSPFQVAESGVSDAYWLVQCETRRRATHLLMAIEAWNLDHHGDLPVQLTDLVGAYIDQLPLDPYTGRPFILAHEGLTQSPRFTTEPLYRPQKPFIWSTGGRVRLSTPPAGFPEHTHYQQPALRTCQVADFNGVTYLETWHFPRSDDEIWLAGTWFEIP